ncbi:hypothetical protein HOLleu_39478 [Holothuria leucospilota]|uniref:Uncharacterized protein n=1 Tax=Holothuria leucospilota TaxID=206669 RepID=A0A9Q1BBY9_HOLLE|nr:hypothetical protein HOLleu_39478 [Holothuria leucospilota]
MIQLPQSNLPHVVYNASYQGEVLLTSMTIRDDTLAAELSDELKEQVSTSYQLLSVFVPLVIGMTEEHAVLNFHHFTNSTKKITYFFGTSTSDFTQVDSIEEAENFTGSSPDKYKGSCRKIRSKSRCPRTSNPKTKNNKTVSVART